MKESIYVWDPVVRIFHWTLVLAFTISYLTGDELETIHAYSGYLILILIFIRVIWGLIGSKYARFSDFVKPVSEAFAYLRGLLTGNARHYTGHNPAGGLMVLALLGSISITGLTGLKTYGLEGHGPLATTSIETSINKTEIDSDEHDEHDEDDDHYDKHDDEESEVWEELHEFFANFTVLLVLLHVIGVYISALFHKENLISAMITGYKEIKKDQA